MKHQKNPAISVIMSVYNGEKYLAESIESILAQTFFNFEFIIINDASSDLTADILERYKQSDSRIKVITNSHNIGLTKSLNRAIRIARGDYISRMDADDISMPERFEIQVEFMERNFDVGIVGTACYLIDPKGATIGEIIYLEHDDRIRKALIRYNPFNHSSIMLRKEVFEKVGLYDERITYAQDYELYFRVSKHYMMANLPNLVMMKRYCFSMVTLKHESEQKRFAISARIKAIKEKQYPWWCCVYLIRPYLVMRTPDIIRRGFRQYVLQSKKIHQGIKEIRVL